MFWNRENPFDANHDGSRAPIDALVILNLVNINGGVPVALAGAHAEQGMLLDVDGDQFASFDDFALLVRQLDADATHAQAAALLALSGAAGEDPSGRAAAAIRVAGMAAVGEVGAATVAPRHPA